MYVLGSSHVIFPMLCNFKPPLRVMARKRDELSGSMRKCREETGKECLCSLPVKLCRVPVFVFVKL